MPVFKKSLLRWAIYVSGVFKGKNIDLY